MITKLYTELYNDISVHIGTDFGAEKLYWDDVIDSNGEQLLDSDGDVLTVKYFK